MTETSVEAGEVGVTTVAGMVEIEFVATLPTLEVLVSQMVVSAVVDTRVMVVSMQAVCSGAQEITVIVVVSLTVYV
jgi:hypothetical protein